MSVEVSMGRQWRFLQGVNEGFYRVPIEVSTGCQCRFLQGANRGFYRVCQWMSLQGVSATFDPPSIYVVTWWQFRSASSKYTMSGVLLSHPVYT